MGGILLEVPEMQIQCQATQPTQTLGIQWKACLCCTYLFQAWGAKWENKA